MKNTSQQSSTTNNYLSELGLTSDESAIYSLLLSAGSLTAKEIAVSLDIIVNSVYRSTKELVLLGLVKKLELSPKQFQPVPARVAIEHLAELRVAKIEQASRAAISQLGITQNPHRLHMDLLTGRQDLFEQFVRLAKKTKQETLVISIGEPVPESIWAVTKQSIARGVGQKFIFHKCDKENIMLIRRWQVMGVPVRHIPSEGYHLNIFDRNAAILSASNTKKSLERTGVVIYNEAIIEALRTYFYQQWVLAQPVGNKIHV